MKAWATALISDILKLNFEECLKDPTEIPYHVIKVGLMRQIRFAKIAKSNHMPHFKNHPKNWDKSKQLAKWGYYYNFVFFIFEARDPLEMIDSL